MDKLVKYLKKQRFKSRMKRSTPGLCYHSVGESSLFEIGLHHVDLDVFDQHINNLKKWGYSIIGIQEYFDEISKGTGERNRITTITFDDGYKNVITSAQKVLEAHDIEGTLFLNTCLLEGRIFWRDLIRVILNENLVVAFEDFLKSKSPELYEKIEWDNFYKSTKKTHVNSKELDLVLREFFNIHQEAVPSIEYVDHADLKNSKNLVFGNHTHNHFRLSSLSKDEQYHEIKMCHENLRGLNLPLVNYMALPFGENGSYNQDTLDILSDLGYNGVFLTNEGQFGLKSPEIADLNFGSMLYSNRILPTKISPI